MTVGTQKPDSVRIPLLLVGIQFLLLTLAVSRYDATSLLFRGTDEIDFFNWFWRFRLADTFSFIDFIIFSILAVLAYQVWKTEKLKISAFDNLAVGLTVLIIISCLVKYIYRGPADTVKDFLFELRNLFFFLAIYLCTSRLHWTEARFQKMMRMLLWLVGLTILLSLRESLMTPSEYLISKYGRVASLRDIEDFLLLMFTQLWLIVLCLEQFPRGLWQRVLVVGCILYSLLLVFTGASKGVLIVYPLLFGYISWYYKLYRRRWFLALASLLGLGIVLLIGLIARGGITDPNSPLYIYTTFNSQDASVFTRGIEILNLGDNLIERKALIQGIGLGTKWFEYVPQPPDEGAYPKSEQGSSWHLGLHVALLRLALDFGLVGLTIIAGLFLNCFMRSLKFLRAGVWQPVTNAFVQASWMAIAYQLIMNSLDIPKTNLFAGFMFGAISGLIDATRQGRLHSVESPREETLDGS